MTYSSLFEQELRQCLWQFKTPINRIDRFLLALIFLRRAQRKLVQRIRLCVIATGWQPYPDVVSRDGDGERSHPQTELDAGTIGQICKNSHVMTSR